MFQKCLLCLVFLVGHAFAQIPATPSEKALQEPIAMDDIKPTAGQKEPKVPSGWSALGSTLLVVSLAGGGLWAFKRFAAKRLPGTGGSRLSVEETLALGDKRFVSILRADEDKFLIAMSPTGITLLARLDGVESLPQGDFDKTLEKQVKMVRPMAVKEMEAMIQGGLK